MMKSVSRVLNRGFTIVELLVVIVVIAILVAITIVAYNNFTYRAQRSAALAELNQLKKTILMAQTQSGKSLREIAATEPAVWGGTSNATYGGASDGIDHPCPPDMTDVKAADTSNECAIVYSRMIDRLASLVGATLTSLKDGDPWGWPYVIDDEEDGSQIENCQSLDRIMSADRDGWRADWGRETES